MPESQVTRRRALRTAAAAGAVGATAAGGATFRTARAQSSRRTFVLVHGAFCGSWVWCRVADKLEQSGHKVFIPTLTGLGERSHLLTKDVDLDIHVQDVINLFKWESLENVCLVVHSYAGFVGSAALEAIGNRVSSIVWLDAFLPSDGQKVLDFTNEAFRNLAQAAMEQGEAGFVPPPKIPAILVAERDQSFVESKLTPQPIGTYLQPIKLAGALTKVAKKTYVRMPKFPQPAFDKALTDCQNEKSWAAFVMSDVGHMAMLDAPDDVSELIVQVA